MEPVCTTNRPRPSPVIRGYIEPDHTGSSQTNLIPIDHYYHDTVLLLLLSVALGRDEGSFGHVGIPILSTELLLSWSIVITGQNGNDLFLK